MFDFACGLVLLLGLVVLVSCLGLCLGLRVGCWFGLIAVC